MYIMRAQKTLLIVTLARRGFGNKSSLTLHVKSIHQGIFIHNCTIYDYKTNSKQQFQSHMKGHGSKEEQKLQKTHKCPNCEKGFFTNSLLKKHLNADTCQIAEKILNVIIAGHLDGLSATHPLLGT